MGIGVSLGLSMNFKAVTARYVDVRLERKKEVLDAYHGAVEKVSPEAAKEAAAKKRKEQAEKRAAIFPFNHTTSCNFLQPFISPRGARASNGRQITF